MGRVLYRVEKLGAETLGFPVPLDEAIEQVRRRAPKEDEGALRIARIEYELDPERPPTIHTDAMRKAWRATVLEFPDIGWMGTYVCKPLQHGRGGNATDWGPPERTAGEDAVEYLWRVFKWARLKAIAGPLSVPYSELIFRSTIATKAQAWTLRTYTGAFHAIHVHGSADPLKGPGACD